MDKKNLRTQLSKMECGKDQINAWNFCSINEPSIIVVGASRLRRVAPIIEGSQ